MFDLNVTTSQGATSNIKIDPKGHFLKVNYETTGFVQINEHIFVDAPNVNERYCAEGEFEIHSPSDHTYNGVHYDVEIEILN